jgi:hypothetical protein
MSIVLVNFQRARDVRLFDHSTGALSVSDAHYWKEADGRFSEQDGNIICLFQDSGRLQLYLDGVNSTIDGELTTSLDANARERRFRAFRGDKLIFEKTYTRKPDSDGNPFWPSDAEDEDAFLWVHNIVSSPERQKILLEQSHRG